MALRGCHSGSQHLGMILLSCLLEGMFHTNCCSVAACLHQGPQTYVLSLQADGKYVDPGTCAFVPYAHQMPPHPGEYGFPP